MQATPANYYYSAAIATSLVSIIVGAYLIIIWRRQHVRLLSDLPFVFALTFFSHAANNYLRSLVLAGIVADSLVVFKIRSLVILGTVLPLMAALLQIWTPHIRRHHPKALAIITAYWVGAVLFASDVLTVLILCIPLVLTVTVLLSLTFLVTWKTNRLKEVRSDLMVIALLCISIGQLAATNLWVNSLFNVLGTIIAAVALTNPWKQRLSAMKFENTAAAPPLTDPIQDLHVRKEPSFSRRPWFSRASLLRLTTLLLLVATVWRLTDIFILHLGSSPLNILPSKVGPLVIVLYVFWRFRREEIQSVLGISPVLAKKHLVVGAVLGISLFASGVFAPQALSCIMSGIPLTAHIANLDLIWYLLFFFLLNALMEEIYFRGLLLNALSTRLSVSRAMVISSALFGIWHIVWPFSNGFHGSRLALEISVSVVFSALLGLFFVIYYVRFSMRQSLIGPITAHTLINFLNETIKIGSATGIQGPDTPASSTFLVFLTAVFFLGFLLVTSLFLWHARAGGMTSPSDSTPRVVSPKPSVVSLVSPESQPHAGS